MSISSLDEATTVTSDTEFSLSSELLPIVALRLIDLSTKLSPAW